MGRPGTWQKGQSGNPGGKNKLVAELRERCLDAVDAKVIAAWRDELEERPREVVTQLGPITVTCRGPYWVKCSELLAAYGIGKPVQPTESKVDVVHHNARDLTRDQLDARIAELEGANVEH